MSRIVGIDFGLRRIGLSRSDPMKILASPLPTLFAGKNHDETVALILKAVAPLSEIESFVVGLPLMLSGKDSDMTLIVRKFAQILEEKSGKKVILWDERFTSKMAERDMREAMVKRKKRSQKVDELAAVIILQSFLESC